MPPTSCWSRRRTIPDPYTFIVTYDEPFAPALISWGYLDHARSTCSKVRTSPPRELGRNPVGTGPYRFKEWSTGEKIVLDSNHDYFEGRPYIDRIIYRIIPDTADDVPRAEIGRGGLDGPFPDPV